MKSLSKGNICIIVLIIGCLMILLIYYFYQWSSGKSVTYQCNNIETNETVQLVLDKPMKYILLWTKPIWSWGHGQERFIKQKCKVKDCYVTPNRCFFPSVTGFDAIAFSGPEITTYMPGPNIRSRKQKYVYVNLESSQYYPICDKRYDGYFNWTWTYKLDSDEPFGYITIRNVTGDLIGPKKIMHWIQLDSMQPIDNEIKLRLKKKSKVAAWFVSNCKSLSKRENFVQRLQKELKNYGMGIDIFGACSWASKSCPKTKMQECLKMIQDDYFFYLSLENSFSDDYVTEKLLTALKNYAVPIVYGAANYTRFMPDGVYLHGGRMNEQELAKEMHDIIQDSERYYSFFKWRNHYSYHNKHEAPDSDNYCRICEMLHDNKLMTKETTYTDFRTWWNVPGKCSSYDSVYVGDEAGWNIWNNMPL